MFELITELFKYFFAWFLIALIFVVALLTELAATQILNMADGYTNRNLLFAYRYARRQYLRGFYGGHCSRIFYPIYTPALAFAALFPVCSSIPYFTFLPIMESGADLLQIINFLLLSEGLVIISIYSLATRDSIFFVNRMIKNLICLYFPLMIFFIVIAMYRKYLGEMDRIFSLDTFSGFYRSGIMNVKVTTGMLIFAFTILSQIPHESFKRAIYFANSSELTSYSGVPRLILNSHSLFRSFIILSVIVELFFTIVSVKLNLGFLSNSWLNQLANFLSFWFSVLIVRVLFIPVVWFIYDRMMRYITERYRIFFISVLSAVATVFIMWGYWF